MSGAALRYRCARRIHLQVKQPQRLDRFLKVTTPKKLFPFYLGLSSIAESHIAEGSASFNKFIIRDIRAMIYFAFQTRERSVLHQSPRPGWPVISLYFPTLIAAYFLFRYITAGLPAWSYLLPSNRRDLSRNHPALQS